MPDFIVSPISVLNQIKSNLQDRYGSGFPILKELLQNADDSRSQTICIDALPGWAAADNPLLRGPGLLVSNDGTFRQTDERGITSFGESSKSTDSAAIGKFGFGQKAVFHFCDAFIVHAFARNYAFKTVVNPFLNVEIDGNVTPTWDSIGDSDLALLRSSAGKRFHEAGLLIWLPLRREGLEPAPRVGFSSNRPTSARAIKELALKDDLRSILAGLRHLREIQIRETGKALVAVRVSESTGRLLVPDQWLSGQRTFAGVISSGESGNGDPARFTGREATVVGGRLDRLRSTEHWPRTISVFNAQPEPEKGAPHGAATLLRLRNPSQSELKVSWAVFLPTAETADISLPLNDTGLGQFRLLLHGYFFLDSGRRHIEGLLDRPEASEPHDAASLRKAWNGELRDGVVLPLIPGVLRDALECQMLSSAELATLVSAISKSDWFQSNRHSICGKDVIVRVFEGARSVVWRILSSGSNLRPLPKSVIDNPSRLAELLPNILAWAKERDIVLCVDESASLAPNAMRWEAAELAALLLELSPRAFQAGALAPLLVEFLALLGQNDETRESIGPCLVSALRKAMEERPPLTATEILVSALEYVPSTMLFRLPPSVENRQVIRVMASANASVLPVRAAWLGESHRSPRLGDADLELLLDALEPLIEDDNSDDAATAAVAMLVSAERELRELAQHPSFADNKVLRARNVRDRSAVAISLRTLLDRSNAGLLFGSSPDANSYLTLLIQAAPDAEPLIVEGRTAEFLRDKSEPTIAVLTANKGNVLSAINGMSRFGPDVARSALLDRLRPSEEDDRDALRRLCAGASAAGAPNANLWVIEDTRIDLERVIKGILNRSSREFLVPARVAEDLTIKMRNRLGIRSLDTPGLEILLEKNVDTIPELELTKAEREAFLLTDISDSLLRRLPIHGRSDGSISLADGLYREGEWRVPVSLREHVITVILSSDALVRKRQESLIPGWSPLTQIEAALRIADATKYHSDILDALAECADQGIGLAEDLLRLLRETAWLIVGGSPVSAQDILTLPKGVDQAARTALLARDRQSAFFTADQLSNKTRTHKAFMVLERQILPDQRASFVALGLMIEDAGLVAHLGRAEEFPLDDFAVMARVGANLALPGWPLMASILAADLSDADIALTIVKAFSRVERPELAGDHLAALATLADENGRSGEAARRAYRYGFDAVATWSEEARKQVFGRTRVPNEAGGWRIGCEVLEDGDGVSPEHVLAREYSSKIRPRQDGAGYQTLKCGQTDISEAVTTSPRVEIRPADLNEIEARSATQHRAFLQAWRGRVPSDLVIIYLGLIGRFPALRELAGEWVSDATADVDTLWADLDRRLNPTLYPNPLAKEVDERRYIIEHVGTLQVPAVAMSGDVIEVPLVGSADGILVGNLHKRTQGIRAADGSVRSLVCLPLRVRDPVSLGQADASSLFRRYVEAICADCLWLGMTNQLQAIQEVLDKAIQVDQATLEETERLLRDRLPTILAELKLPTSSHVQKALRDYQASESRMNRLSSKAAERDELKIKLWESVKSPIAIEGLIVAVRAKINDFGYSPSRVLFELFQNADDAYRQLDDVSEEACFRVELRAGGQRGFQVTHWGRPINHLGANADEGRRLGHDRDLLNMLLMNFSEKRAEDDLTGKFGLGFKSVHILSDSVGIASGFISLRTRGGFLPETWHEGLDEVETRRRGDGRKATFIDVPFSIETLNDGDAAVRAFRVSMVWLPVFARRIRRVEVRGEDQASVVCRIYPLLGDGLIEVVELHDGITQRALRFNLGGRVSFLLKMESAGPTRFPEGIRRVWNLAPLEEDLHSGWILNGPFAVDPGRGRLAGSIESRQGVFKRLGQALGECLVSFYDFAASEWQNVAKALDLDFEATSDPGLFWSRLFDVFGHDLDDDLARHVHVDGRGYAHLVSMRPVVPTRLPEPFGGLVCAAGVEHYTLGALSDRDVLLSLRGWLSLQSLKGSMVAPEVAEKLRKLGFERSKPVNLSTLLLAEMGKERRIDIEVASRLGEVLSPADIENEPIRLERYEILDVAKQAVFRAQDGSWRSVKELSSVRTGQQDEQMRCAFSPDHTLLHADYSDAGVEFFRVARTQSGYGPQPSTMIQWAMEAATFEKQQAVLLYVLSGDQRSGLAHEIRKATPPWMPQPIEGLFSSVLLDGWREDDKKKLLLELGGGHLFGILSLPETQAGPNADPKDVLRAVHAWWDSAKVSERAEYDKRLYPAFFAPLDLGKTDARRDWFTMFALACFQSLGRTQEAQHRAFLERGQREGWWDELANSRPPRDLDAWIGRLEGWSSSAEVEQTFLPWRRAFVDLYTVARWLEEYVEIIRKLPRIVEHHGPVSLNDILRPSFSPLLGPLGINAAPINRSLGIGLNWMIRELLRNGIYESKDQQRMASYCWAPTKRVRELLQQLGGRVGEAADKEASRAIYGFVVEQIGADFARFDGDFDLPLQIVTQTNNRQILEQCFEQAGSELPPEAYRSDMTEDWEA